MNYKEIGFRAFDYQFCVLPITKQTKAALTGFPGAEDANGVLTYGYYDRTAGLKPEGCWARIIGLGDRFFMQLY